MARAQGRELRSALDSLGTVLVIVKASDARYEAWAHPHPYPHAVATQDPLFPQEWADRRDDSFSNASLQYVGCGHFVPLEAASSFAAAIPEACLLPPKAFL